MRALLTRLLSGLGRRAAHHAALAAALAIAVCVMIRHGRRQAEAALAIRRAEARIRAMQAARETRHDVQNADRVDLDRRANRWMRD